MMVVRGMVVIVVMLIRRMAFKQMDVSMAHELADQVKDSQRDQRAAGNERKVLANAAVNRHAAPNNQSSKRRGEENMTHPGETGNS